MSLAITQDQKDWTPEQRRVLPSVVNGKASEAELQLLLHTCQRTGLDVFSKQMYAISRGGKLSIQTSIDGFRTVASRAATKRGLIIGNKPVVYYNRAGNALPFAPDDLFALTYTVTITGANGAMSEMSATLKLNEYQQQSPFWKKMPGVMLAKCAEAVSLRSAFPDDLGGIYTTDEFDAADNKQNMVSAPRKPEQAPQSAEVSTAADGEDPFSAPQGIAAGAAKNKLVARLTESGMGKDAAVASARAIWSGAGLGSDPITEEQLAAILAEADEVISSEQDEEEVK